jgi:hypothetical protein
MSLRRFNRPDPIPVREQPFSLPANLLVNFLDQDDPGASSLIYETVTDVLFGVFTGGNVNSRSDQILRARR